MMEDFNKAFLVFAVIAVFITIVFLVANVGSGYHHGNPRGGLTPSEEYRILNR